MAEKLAKRKQREADAIRGGTKAKVAKVSDKELFARAGDMIKVVRAKHGS